MLQQIQQLANGVAGSAGHITLSKSQYLYLTEERQAKLPAEGLKAGSFRVKVADLASTLESLKAAPEVSPKEEPPENPTPPEASTEEPEQPEEPPEAEEQPRQKFKAKKR